MVDGKREREGVVDRSRRQGEMRDGVVDRKSRQGEESGKEW